jgi:hypothetical protein
MKKLVMHAGRWPLLLSALLVLSCVPPVPTPDPGQVAAPQLSPGGSTSTKGLRVAMSTATEGAAIHYTTDDSVPTADSPVYAEPILVCGVGSRTVKALAVKAGMKDSDVSAAVYEISQPARWARSTEVGQLSSSFECAATDGASIYVAGEAWGTDSYTFGGAATAQGTSDNRNVLLVKYDSSGSAQWARTVVGGINPSRFQGVSADSAGNVFAVGFVFEDFAIANDLKFADTAEATLSMNAGSENHAVLVRYDSAGNVIWARSVSSQTHNGGSDFNRILADGSSLFVTGSLTIGETYDFGNGVTATGTTTNTDSLFLAKYDYDGKAKWVMTPVTGNSESNLWDVVEDKNGFLYLAGWFSGQDSLDFGSGVKLTPPNLATHAMVVKVSPSGAPVWARAVVKSVAESRYYGIAVDGQGNVYVSGYLMMAGEYGFGNGITAQAVGSWMSGVFVKYDPDGNALWARPCSSNDPSFLASAWGALQFDADGCLCVAGGFAGRVDLGNGVSVTGPCATDYNALVAKYDTDGSVHWAQAVAQGTSQSLFNSCVIGASGSLYAAGSIQTTASYGFGNGVTTHGSYASGGNVLLVKYQ